MDKLHLSSTEGTVDCYDCGLVIIVSECPVDERSLAGLRWPVDDVCFAYDFAVDLAIGLSDGHHPLFTLEDLIVGVD